MKAKSAHPSMIPPMMERLGSTVLLDPVPSSKDEMTTGSLSVALGSSLQHELASSADVLTLSCDLSPPVCSQPVV